jgi:predicted transcriptional regulator of viral defense system
VKLLTKHILSRLGGRVATRTEIQAACRRFGADPERTLNFMISYGYLIRILRGLYYVRTLEEFKLEKAPGVLRLLSLGLSRLRVRWYFGLHTALALNGLTHEFPGVTFVLNDAIFRPKDIRVAGERVRFVKLKPRLFGFGITERDGIRFSDAEKTILDMVYLSRYRGVPRARAVSMASEHRRNLKREKLKAYLRFYPKTVGEVARDAGLL